MPIIKSVKFLFSILREDKFVCSENKYMNIKAVNPWLHCSPWETEVRPVALAEKARGRPGFSTSPVICRRHWRADGRTWQQCVSPLLFCD